VRRVGERGKPAGKLGWVRSQRCGARNRPLFRIREPSPKIRPPARASAEAIVRRVSRDQLRLRIGLAGWSTGPESQWSTIPSTCDLLGIYRFRWYELLTTRSRWRLAGEGVDPYRILSALALEADPTIPKDRIRDALRVRIQRFRDSLLNVPTENVDALRRLRSGGFRLGLISNADVMEVAAWGDCPLAGLFDAEVFSCVVGCVKPEAAIHENCFRSLGLSGDECLYVGDGGSNELVGAQALGMSTVFMSGVIAELWPERVKQRVPLADHHVARSPRF
jgi:putative hydrolase of the HAD superfamily